MTKDERFAEVFQQSIEVAERRLEPYDSAKDPLQKSDLENIIRVLRNQKRIVIRQGVEVYEGAYGPSKHLIDLGEPANSELSNSVYQIEVFYKKNYLELMTKEEVFAGVIERAIDLAKGELEAYDSNTAPLTKELLASIVDTLSERRQRALTDVVKPYERTQYEFVRELDGSSQLEGSALTYVVHEMEAFHKANF
ncbi:MAG TPA: hypothetical protein VJV05_15155 [Pyrinomonadaceae bacterium]|nr:hypothetical protein [Pyrinomonadaceae bacterium]